MIEYDAAETAEESGVATALYVLILASPDEVLTMRAQEILHTLTLREKVGQMFMAHYPASDAPELTRTLQPAVIYFLAETSGIKQRQRFYRLLRTVGKTPISRCFSAWTRRVVRLPGSAGTRSSGRSRSSPRRTFTPAADGTRSLPTRLKKTRC